ncbi:MAG: CRISPR-associated ring nuclease Crn3/Csx3 [Candidatus Caldarchaeum sp.]
MKQDESNAGTQPAGEGASSVSSERKPVSAWKVAENTEFFFVEFELAGGVITPPQLEEVVRSFPLPPPRLSGRGVVISGRGPIWLYSALVHHLHPAPWVACYDPRLGGGVVVASHVPNLRVGDVVKVDYNSLIFSSPSSSSSSSSPSSSSPSSDKSKRVAILGDPNSGKSVFLRILYDILASQVSVISQEADLTAPTQGWSLSPVGAEIRKALKKSLSPASRLDWILKSLEGLVPFPGIVLVDVGGGRPDLGVRVTEENQKILSLCTHVVICSRNDEGQIDAWMKEIHSKVPHLKVVAVCESRLEGEAGQENDRFVLTGLDRTLYANGLIPFETLKLIRAITEVLIQ